ADEFGVSSHVRFRGLVDEETLRAAYRNCDIFVLPSAGEGFGIVFLEAMHYAKPIIAANCGATPEVVNEGGNGLLIDYANFKQLTEAIVSLSLDPERRERMGLEGRERLQEKFGFATFKRKLSEIVLSELPATISQTDEPQIARSAGSF